MKTVIAVILFMTTLNAQADLKTRNCTPDIIEDVVAVDKQAREELDSTLAKLEDRNTLGLDHVLQSTFGFDRSDSAHLERLKARLRAAREKIDTIKYVCGAQNDFWCKAAAMKGAFALVPPPKQAVHLCRPFMRLSQEDRAGVLIHELMHASGGSQIDYLPEKYCWAEIGGDPDNALRRADMYRLFVTSVSGHGVSCGL